MAGVVYIVQERRLFDPEVQIQSDDYSTVRRTFWILDPANPVHEDLGYGTIASVIVRKD